MSRISSVRWNKPELFENALAYAEAHHEKMNALIMKALSEYLKDKVPHISKLRSQTANFVSDSSEFKTWAQGQDTRGWE
jgi:hypothetical protein